VPGRISLTYHGNWKMQMDNGIDPYHLTSTHAGFMDVMGRRRDGEGNQAARQFDWQKRLSQQGGAFLFKNGHSAIWLNQAEVEKRPIYPAIEAIRARVGDTRADWMLKLKPMAKDERRRRAVAQVEHGRIGGQRHVPQRQPARISTPTAASTMRSAGSGRKPRGRGTLASALAPAPLPPALGPPSPKRPVTIRVGDFLPCPALSARVAAEGLGGCAARYECLVCREQ
jgi:hypothetical protein